MYLNICSHFLVTVLATASLCGENPLDALAKQVTCLVYVFRLCSLSMQMWPGTIFCSVLCLQCGASLILSCWTIATSPEINTPTVRKTLDQDDAQWLGQSATRRERLAQYRHWLLHSSTLDTFVSCGHFDDVGATVFKMFSKPENLPRSLGADGAWN